MGKLARKAGIENGKKLATQDAASWAQTYKIYNYFDNADVKFKSHASKFTGTSVDEACLKLALQKDDNGDCLAEILRTLKDPTEIKIAILNLLIADENNIFGKGGFRADSFKVAFIGAYLSVDFSQCHSDAARKAAIKTKLETMRTTEPKGSKLKTALDDILLRSNTFKTPAPKTAGCFSRLFGKASAPAAAAVAPK